jgi:magnesium transporter
MLDPAAAETTNVPQRRGVVACAIYRDGQGKKPASWGAILTLAAAIASIYGMNFKHVPELEWSFGYPAVSLLMLALCSFLYYLFRRMAWL